MSQASTGTSRRRTTDDVVLALSVLVFEVTVAVSDEMVAVSDEVAVSVPTEAGIVDNNNAEVVVVKSVTTGVLAVVIVVALEMVVVVLSEEAVVVNVEVDEETETEEVAAAILVEDVVVVGAAEIAGTANDLVKYPSEYPATQGSGIKSSPPLLATNVNNHWVPLLGISVRGRLNVITSTCLY